MDELIERLALRLAKSEGWDVETVNLENPRMKKWMSVAQYCLEEIYSYLRQEELSFDDLDVSARYDWGAGCNTPGAKVEDFNN